MKTVILIFTLFTHSHHVIDMTEFILHKYIESLTPAVFLISGLNKLSLSNKPQALNGQNIH